MALNRLIAHLGLDKTGFDAGLSAAGKGVVRFGSDIKSQLAGAFSVAAVTQYIHGLTETVNRIKDLSEQYGITSEEVQRADFSLKQSGLQFEDLSSALVALGRHRRDAAEGNEELRATFERFGISLSDLQNPANRTFDLFLKLASAQRDGNITAKEQVALMDLLGPRAGKLVNILSSLSSVKIDVISDQSVARIDAAVKYLERFKQQIDAIAATKLAQILQLGSYLPLIGGGKNQLAADFAEGIAGALKPGGNAAAAGIANLGGLQPKPQENMWDEIVKKSASAGRPAGIQSDQFQRIGAFTGAAGASAQDSRAIRVMTYLEQIKAALTSSGIIVKGTD